MPSAPLVAVTSKLPTGEGAPLEKFTQRTCGRAVTVMLAAGAPNWSTIFTEKVPSFGTRPTGPSVTMGSFTGKLPTAPPRMPLIGADT